MKKPIDPPPVATDTQASVPASAAALNVNEPPKSLTNTSEKAKEYGGPKGLEPTRYGDWEKNGRCTDF